MSLGFTVMGVAHKRDQSGAPFAANAADNGNSVDPVSGRIVSGNDVGAVGSPAQLLSDREILLNMRRYFLTQGNIGIANLTDNLGYFFETGIVYKRSMVSDFGNLTLDQHGDSNGVFVGIVSPP